MVFIADDDVVVATIKVSAIAEKSERPISDTNKKCTKRKIN